MIEKTALAEDVEEAFRTALGITKDEQAASLLLLAHRMGSIEDQLSKLTEVLSTQVSVVVRNLD